MTSIDRYDLHDPDVLRVASELSPDLFVALRIAAKLKDRAYPIETDNDLEAALAIVAGKSGVFEGMNIRIAPGDPKDRFPNEFLPIVDRFDLIRKLYMAIIIAHQSDSQPRIDAARAGTTTGATHPINLEVL